MQQFQSWDGPQSTKGCVMIPPLDQFPTMERPRAPSIHLAQYLREFRNLAKKKIFFQNRENWSLRVLKLKYNHEFLNIF